MRRLRGLLGIALWLVWAASAWAQAAVESRVALVIGNAGYRHSPLANAVADARLMEQVLRESGFDVVRAENVGRRDMVRLIRELGNRIKVSGGTGLFYFAGHGVQIRGENYLVSTDSDMRNEEEVADDSVSAQSILERMSASGSRVNILILDACRNNPFAARARAIRGGLASMSAPAGSLVAFSTAPGEVASDGLIGTNGLYTAHLARSMREPGLRIEEVLKRTRAAVLRDSGNQQTPWENSALLGDFYFRPPTNEAAGAALPQPAGLDAQIVERLYWQSISGRDNRSDFEEYLRAYPQGAYSAAARERLAKIDAELAFSAPLQRPSRLELNAAAHAVAVGDRWRFRDSGPGGSAQDFERVVTNLSRDEIEFDRGQLTVRRIGSTARNNPHGELFEDANELRSGGSWSGAFVPAAWRGERTPVKFTFVDVQTRELGGRTWRLVRATIAGTTIRTGFFGSSVPIRGQALIDEETGVIVEFDLRCDEPVYQLRREWLGFERRTR